MANDRNSFRTWIWWSLGAAIAAGLFCAVVFREALIGLWPLYLTAYMIYWPITLGAAGLLAIGNLTGGRWALAARPLYLAISATAPLIAILFIPIALNLDAIYPWAAETTREQLHLPPSKAFYLSPSFFLWRSAGYLAVWLVVVWLLNVVSRPPHLPSDTPAMRRIGALSLVLLAPTATFAAFDWGMSLEPEWYSSIYGAIIIAGGVLAAHALSLGSIVATSDLYGFVDRAAALDREAHGTSPVVLVSRIYNDFGNLLLAFLMVFSYFALSQFLIIWSANLPSEITWYLRRSVGGWQWLAITAVLLNVVAFFQLLSRDNKRTPPRLGWIAMIVLTAYVLHAFWMFVPALGYFDPVRLAATGAAILALGGIWLAAFSWLASRKAERHLGERTTMNAV